MLPAAVLLDLDDTLVVTRALVALRQARRWSDVYAGFGRTRLPRETPRFLAELRALGSIGVVTTSPRTYAERLLAFHQLDVPVVVAYHDVAPRKPDPAPILRALEVLGVEPQRAVHIGDTNADEVAAGAAGVHSILVAWRAGPDDPAESWDPVITAVRQQLVTR